MSVVNAALAAATPYQGPLMNTFTRTAAALIVGGTLVLGGGVACATPHTTDGYISEVRAGMDDYESRNMADAQIVSMGQAMCAYPEMLEPAFYQNEYTSPADQERSIKSAEIAKRYCDVLPPMTNPVSETDAGIATYGDPGGAGAYGAGAYPTPPPAPPAPIVIGQTNALNYGGQDVATWTVNSVDYCGAYLRMNVTMTTSDMYVPGQDNVMHRTQWTDTEGITHDNAGISAYDCGEELYTGYNTKPGKTYRGVVTFDIPQGQLASLDVYGSDDRQYVYTPEN